MTASGADRFAGLDSLRSLAGLGGFLFHASYVALFELGIDDKAVLLGAGLGRAGADLFFVLSGFLITERLLSARDREGCFTVFCWRRLLRIVPAYRGRSSG